MGFLIADATEITFLFYHAVLALCARYRGNSQTNTQRTTYSIYFAIRRIRCKPELRAKNRDKENSPTI